MRFPIVVAVLSLAASISLAQTRLVPFVWVDQSLEENVTGLWYDQSTGVVWLAGRRSNWNDSDDRGPRIWTIGLDDEITMLDIPELDGEPRSEFGPFSPNGEWVVLQPNSTDLSQGMDSVTLRRGNWSERLEFAQHLPGGAGFQMWWPANSGNGFGHVQQWGPERRFGFYTTLTDGEYDPLWPEGWDLELVPPFITAVTESEDRLTGIISDQQGKSHAAVWDWDGTQFTFEFLPEGEGTESWANVISPDGTTIPGYSWPGTGSACIWIDGVRYGLEQADGSPQLGIADLAFNDGTVIGRGNILSRDALFIWHPTELPGAIPLAEYFAQSGSLRFPEEMGGWGQCFASESFYHLLVFGKQSERWYYVEMPRLGDPCVADFNRDGSVNSLDVLSFLNAWVAGDGRADINGDGLIDTLDFLAFLNLWVAGC